MRRAGFTLWVVALILCLTACTAPQSNPKEDTAVDTHTFYLTVEGATFPATFADNQGAEALANLLTDGPLTLSLDDYGGFEKVGSLGQTLPTSNTHITTQSGDIVLYQGRQIVLFYGSNSWSYTRLGRVTDLTGWKEALGQSDVTVTLSLTAPH